MKNLKPNVYSVGVIDWDRRFFDELIPLPDGTSYNSYLIKGSEKVALIDTVDPEKTTAFVDNILKTGIDKIDYLVCNHCEQDHSGTIPDILLLYPDAKVVTNTKCKGMLVDHLELEDDKFIIIEDNETLSLGDKTLQFVFTPWVHWPETMSTYLQEDKILFSCDMFGSHLATSELIAKCDDKLYNDAKRYYAEIMMPFRPAVRKNVARVSELELDLIAPSHGPVYDKPSFIIDAYSQWAGDEVKNMVLIPFVSMHHSTRKMVEYLTEALIDRDVPVQPFNIRGGDIGELAVDLVDAATIVLGSPQVLTTAHPDVAYVALLANALRPKTKFASIIGSYGWGGKMVDNLAGMISNLKVELIDPVMGKGFPDENVFAQIDQLADKIVAKHKEIGLI